ncbi:MAG: hypothetical protein JO142_02055 [Burkholderiales bacterium]|nr:hypothetical protein [Burkholderiales bacterium]
MTRHLLTEDQVASAIEAIFEGTLQLFIIAIRAKSDSASRTSTKSPLDPSALGTCDATADEPCMPAELETKVRDLASLVWELAVENARRAMSEQCGDAVANAGVHQEARIACVEIERLQSMATEQAAVIERLQARIHELEHAHADATEQLRRVPVLKAALADTVSCLDAARVAAIDRAIETDWFIADVTKTYD